MLFLFSSNLSFGYPSYTKISAQEKTKTTHKKTMGAACSASSANGHTTLPTMSHTTNNNFAKKTITSSVTVITVTSNPLPAVTSNTPPAMVCSFAPAVKRSSESGMQDSRSPATGFSVEPSLLPQMGHTSLRPGNPIPQMIEEDLEDAG